MSDYPYYIHNGMYCPINIYEDIDSKDLGERVERYLKSLDDEEFKNYRSYSEVGSKRKEIVMDITNLDLGGLQKMKSKVTEIQILTRLNKLKELGCSSRDINSMGVIAKTRRRVNQLFNESHTAEAVALATALEDIEHQLEVMEESSEQVPLAD